MIPFGETLEGNYAKTLSIRTKELQVTRFGH